MRIYVDVNTQTLVSELGTRSPIPFLEFKRGDTARVEVVFFRGITPIELADGAEAVFGLKEKGKYDADRVVEALEWVKEGEGVETVYVFQPNFNTESLNDLLGSDDGDEENDVASVELMGEIRWTIDSAVYATQTFPAIVANDVNKGIEGTPIVAGDAALEWLGEHGVLFDPDVIGLTGGGDTKLDGLEVTADHAGQLRAVHVSGGALHFFELVTGDWAEVVPTMINVDSAPDALSWRLVSIRAGAVTAAQVISTGNVQARDFTAAGAPGVQDGEVGIYNADNKLATIKSTELTDDREHQVPDRDGTLAPFIDIAGNATDHAGLILVAGVIKLVARNQDTGDWLELYIRDSGLAGGGAASGIPTIVYSDPL